MKEEKKVCKICKEAKGKGEFYLISYGRYVNSYCKECVIKQKMKWQKENREAYREYHRKIARDSFRRKYKVKKPRIA